MKYKKYMKKMKRKILVGASGGLIAGVLIAGAGTAHAADTSDYAPGSVSSIPASGMHLMRRWNSDAKIGSLASSLGLDKQYVQQELKDGKTLKQILQEHGIVLDQLNKAFTYGTKNKKRNT